MTEFLQVLLLGAYTIRLAGKPVAILKNIRPQKENFKNVDLDWNLPHSYIPTVWLKY